MNETNINTEHLVIVNPITIPILGTDIKIEIEKDKQLFRSESQEGIGWSYVENPETFANFIEAHLENLYVTKKEEYFTQYEPPFIDAPIVSKFQSATPAGNSQVFELSLKFKTLEERENLKDFLDKIYQSKVLEFESGKMLDFYEAVNIARTLPNIVAPQVEEEVEIHQPIQEFITNTNNT